MDAARIDSLTGFRPALRRLCHRAAGKIATHSSPLRINMPFARRFAPCCLALMLSLPVAAAGPEAPATSQGSAPGSASASAPKSKPAAKPTQAATGRQQLKNEAAGLALATATAETISEAQLEMASRVLTGFADCEFKQRITVAAIDGVPGHFNVGHKGLQYRMVPQETSTGAVRLEDKAAGVMWLQIPAKSMLMNVKVGQRMVDGCQHASQRETSTGVANASTSLGIVAPGAAKPATAAP
jgi:hypothetical protein